jgi:hypothetical protein
VGDHGIHGRWMFDRCCYIYHHVRGTNSCSLLGDVEGTAASTFERHHLPDIKSDNILLSVDGNIKLSKFSPSRLLEDISNYVEPILVSVPGSTRLRASGLP